MPSSAFFIDGDEVREDENGRRECPHSNSPSSDVYFEVLAISFGAQKSQLRVSEVDCRSKNQRGRCKRAPSVDLRSSDQAFWERFGPHFGSFIEPKKALEMESVADMVSGPKIDMF